MVLHLDLQSHFGIDQRFVKRIGDMNFKRYLDARLQLGCGLEPDLEIAFAFQRRYQTKRAQQESDAFHETILATLAASQ